MCAQCEKLWPHRGILSATAEFLFGIFEQIRGSHHHHHHKPPHAAATTHPSTMALRWRATPSPLKALDSASASAALTIRIFSA